MKIKAINTNYKGYKFRSRLEARWAVYFDSIGLEWEYEKEGYVLENGVRYLPDFYIPYFGFIEIKGTNPNEKELQKAMLLSKNDGYAEVAILIGTPNKEIKEYVCFSAGERCSGCCWSTYTVRKWGQIPYYGEHPDFDNKDIASINKARSARFEFGGLESE